MKECAVCHCKLGLFATNNQIKDGYVCDNCLNSAQVKKLKKDTTVKDVKDAIYNKDKEQQKSKTIAAQTRTEISPYEIFCQTANRTMSEYISFNETTHQFAIRISPDIYDYNQLVSYEYLENNHVETIVTQNGGIGRAIIGGAVAGGVGAIVGSTTASNKTKTTETITSMSIRITLTPNAQLKYIKFLDTACEKTSPLYTDRIEKVYKVLSILDTIKYYNEQSVKSNVPNNIEVSVPEQIKQYKDLLDCGAITQDEYETKKKQLLNI